MIQNLKFDLDGCLVDWAGYFKKLMKAKKYTLVETGKFHWDIYNSLGMSLFQSEMKKLVYDSFKDIWEVKPMPDAQNFINYYHELTKQPIDIITHRPISHATETHAVFARLFPGIPNKITFVDDSSKKAYYMGNYSTFYEDRRKTAIEMAHAGINVIIPKRDYNWPIEPYKLFNPATGVAPAAFHFRDFEPRVSKTGFGQIIYVDGIKDLFLPEFDRFIFKTIPARFKFSS